MVSGRELPPARSPEAGKKRQTQIVAAVVIVGIAALSIALLLLLASISSFSVPWLNSTRDSGPDLKPVKVPNQVTEADYTGIWQGFTPDRKSHTIKFMADNRFRHWIADNISIHVYNGSWRYDSSLYVYKLVYDREDYSASVKIYPATEGELRILHFEPLSSAQGMPLKGLDMEKVEVSPAAPEY